VIDGQSLLGCEVDSIGQEACQLILESIQLEGLNSSPLIINLAGFSRGGIVNLYIVNYLQQLLQKLEEKLICLALILSPALELEIYVLHDLFLKLLTDMLGFYN
jgi:hypothetical protein